MYLFGQPPSLHCHYPSCFSKFFTPARSLMILLRMAKDVLFLLFVARTHEISRRKGNMRSGTTIQDVRFYLRNPKRVGSLFTAWGRHFYERQTSLITETTEYTDGHPLVGGDGWRRSLYFLGRYMGYRPRHFPLLQYHDLGRPENGTLGNKGVFLLRKDRKRPQWAQKRPHGSSAG